MRTNNDLLCKLYYEIVMKIVLIACDYNWFLDYFVLYLHVSISSFYTIDKTTIYWLQWDIVVDIDFSDVHIGVNYSFFLNDYSTPRHSYSCRYRLQWRLKKIIKSTQPKAA